MLDRRSTRASGVALRKLPAGQRAELEAAIRRYLSAVDRVTALEASGQFDEARTVVKTLEEPAFDMLREATASLTTISQTAARVARREADAGSVAILVLGHRVDEVVGSGLTQW